jgi:hypothetical protein
MKKKPFMWTMRDGTKIAVVNMSNEHLDNAIALMERNAERYRQGAINSGFQMLSMLQGEQAIYAVESEMDRLTDGEWDLYDESEAYRALVDEKERRTEPKL